MSKNTYNQGFVLTGAMMLLLIGMLVAGSFLFVSRQSNPAVDQWARYDQALLAAQTAAENIKAAMYDDFVIEYKKTSSWDELSYLVDNAASYSITNGRTLGQILGAGVTPYSNAVITAVVTCGNTTANRDEWMVFVTNRVTAAIGGTARTLEEVICYKLKQSKVFDNAYFINNFGWFRGVDCVINGEIGSNKDMELGSPTMTLNGWSCAVTNRVDSPYTSWDWDTYANRVSGSSRPTQYVDQNTNNAAAFFLPGYGGAGIQNDCDERTMPPIGNLEAYKAYATANNGTISISNRVVVNNIFAGTGPSGVTNAADKGCIVLVGTQTRPIVLNGPVVITGDVIIKGYYTGQGTIYAGRNVHIIDDLIAVNPPAWRQDDTADNFNRRTLPNNLDADFIGLCAKGSVIIGDYRRFSSSHLQYLSTAFTDPYEVTTADADIGYVSYTTADGVPMFDGNYLATYGRKCGNSNPASGVNRKYYESSLSDTRFSSYDPQINIARLDAFIYNNHLTAGCFNAAQINGGVICRDEALMAGGRTTFNWDPRVAVESTFRPYLPLAPAPAETVQWREI